MLRNHVDKTSYMIMNFTLFKQERILENLERAHLCLNLKAKSLFLCCLLQQ
jgi:hypothetical protein